MSGVISAANAFILASIVMLLDARRHRRAKREHEGSWQITVSPHNDAVWRRPC